MTPRRYALLFAGLSLLVAGGRVLAQTPAPSTGTVSFTAYYSIGDSLAAGYVSASLVETHQVHSMPAHLARQAGVTDFQQPLMTEPGIPAELTLLRLSPAPLIAPKAASPGAPKNLALGRSYNNLAVPGASTVDALQRVTDNGGLHDLILRGRGSQVTQTVASRPTVVTLWIGNNDVLAAAVGGRVIEGLTITPADTFRALYQQVVTALKTTDAKIFAANLPDVTTIPYVTTIQPVVVNPATGAPVLNANGQQVPLLGPNGPLPPGSYVTLMASSLLAQGHGIPTAYGGLGTPLPDQAVLDPSEVSFIRARVAANNQAIREICQAAGIPVVDLNALLKDTAEHGRNIGGITLSSAFLTGGFFSYDGVHPTELGYAVTANEWIRVINANGGQLPEVNVAPYLGIGARPASARQPRVFPEFSREAYESLLEAFPPLSSPSR